MLIGVGLKLKDKRVDKMLRAKGITEAAIYYSPIMFWLLFWVLMIQPALWLIVVLSSSVYGLLLIPYFITSYLLYAYHFNSFAFHNDQLIIINPNFPFRKMTILPLKDIQQATIDKSKRKWPQAFMLFSENYLLLQTNTCTIKYYCAGLEEDAYDENWTEKTIEDLDITLRERGVATDFKLY